MRNVPAPVKAKPRKTKEKDVIKSISDDYGNLLILRKNSKRVLISLKLVSEEITRRIGTLNKAQRTLTIKRKRGKHLFRKANAYGFNHRLLETSKLIDYIRLEDETSEWKIPREEILKKGSFLYFQKQGFEKQIFLSLDSMQEFIQETKI